MGNVNDKAQTYREKGYWTDRLLTDYFERTVASTPAKIAVKDERFGAVTYGEMAPMVMRLAAGLQAKGIGRGDKFVVALPNWHQVPAFVLALNYIGAIAVHMPFTGGGHEFSGVLKVTDAKGIAVAEEIRGANYVSLIDGIAGDFETLDVLITVGCEQEHAGWVTFDRLLAEAPGDQPIQVEPLTPSELSLLLFTSGSSGDPKGVMHSSNTISALNTTVAPIYDLGSDDVIFMAAPLGFSAGYAHGLRLALYLGATLILQESWNADRALELMAHEKATFTLTTPTLLRDLLASEQFAKYSASLVLRLMFCGGTYVTSDLLREVRKKLPRTLTSVIWGMTEGIGTACRPGAAEERVTGTDGESFLGTELKVIAEDGSDVAAGEVGDLVMRGPQLFMGYYKRPELNEEVFLPGGWFRTGDMAMIDGEGFLKITGRRKELIIRGGANISPAEIEETLYGDERIRQLAVVGIPDERLDERVCACVVPNDKGSNLTLADIVEISERHGLAKNKWPQRLEIVDSLPMTPSGKLQRMVLREQIMERLGD